jgi:hypothetical protein
VEPRHARPETLGPDTACNSSRNPSFAFVQTLHPSHRNVTKLSRAAGNCSAPKAQAAVQCINQSRTSRMHGHEKKAPASLLQETDAPLNLHITLNLHPKATSHNTRHTRTDAAATSWDRLPWSVCS